MTYFEKLLADIAGRFEMMDQRCAEVEENMSDLREDLVRLFAGLNAP